jgi:hypothetical protein
MAAKTDKLKVVKDGGYAVIRIQSKISPILYKTMLEAMESIGVSNESTYISMAIKKLNDEVMNKFRR